MKLRLLTSAARSRASCLPHRLNQQRWGLATSSALLISDSKIRRLPQVLEQDPSPSVTSLYTIRQKASSVAAPAAPTDSSEANIPAVLVNDIRNQELLIEVIPSQAVRYPSFWLRDHCLCSTCSHPHTHQRQHDSFTLDPRCQSYQCFCK